MKDGDLNITGPRVSANEMAAYVFETPSGKIRNLKDQKFKNQKRSYYTRAMNGVIASFLPNTGTFEPDIIQAAERRIRAVSADTKKKADRLRSNAEMLRRFAEICGQVRPPKGLHDIVRRNALFSVGGIAVSVRPEIVTRTAGKKFAMTKFRFSQSAVSEDVSEIVLLILLRYGQEAFRNEGSLDLEHTCLVDCFSRSITYGHKLAPVRERQLERAFAEVAHIWPKLTPQSKATDFF